MRTITLTKPDDWHLHLRDGIFLKTTVPAAAKQFRRAIIMPNLSPPVINAAIAREYYQRIMHWVPDHHAFTPLMTLYLTDHSDAEMIKEAKTSGIIYACKLYPRGATTHSHAGVSDIRKIYPALEAMVESGLPLLLHGEVTDPGVDIFDREKIFIERILQPLIRTFPGLKMVLEHITTQEAVKFIQQAPANVAATITAHHLLLNRNDIFSSGIDPHHYCLPILKRRIHQEALIHAATSGHKKFFLGTDSAPHPIHQKECRHGCAGIYTSHAALELYAEVFDQENILEKLEAFASFNGADFYGLPRNQEQITLIRQTWEVPEKVVFGNEELVPFQAGKTLRWRLCMGAVSKQA